MQEISASLVATGLRFAIVAGRFNEFIVDGLVKGACDALVQHGGDLGQVTLVRVPGSYEIPLIAKLLAESGKYDAIIALGAVIRGATSHYDLVCSQAASGLSTTSLTTRKPIIFGVITTDSIEQAIERCGTKAGNKGREAAVAAIEMANLVREISSGT